MPTYQTAWQAPPALLTFVVPLGGSFYAPDTTGCVIIPSGFDLSSLGYSKLPINRFQLPPGHTSDTFTSNGRTYSPQTIVLPGVLQFPCSPDPLIALYPIDTTSSDVAINFNTGAVLVLPGYLGGQYSGFHYSEIVNYP